MFKPDNLISDEQKSSYEYERAQYLKTLMDEADALLDIHASFTPESKPFLICEKSAFSVAAQLPFDTIVSGFDAVEPGGTEHYMNQLGKIGLGSECGYLGDSVSTKRAVALIQDFLFARGHTLSGSGLTKTQQKHYKIRSLYSTKTEKFVLTRQFADFENIQEGDVIGYDGDEAIQADTDGMILFARNREKIGEEAFLLGVEDESF